MLHSKSPLILQFAQNGDGKEVLDDAIKDVPKRIPESEPGDALTIYIKLINNMHLSLHLTRHLR